MLYDVYWMIPASITGATLDLATIQGTYTFNLRTVGREAGGACLVCGDSLIFECEKAERSEKESQLEEPGQCAGQHGVRGGRPCIGVHMDVFLPLDQRMR